MSPCVALILQDLYRDIAVYFREKDCAYWSFDGKSGDLLVHEVVCTLTERALTRRVEAEGYGNGGPTWCDDNIAAFVNVQNI